MALRRGDIWAVSGGDYASKPRPAVIIQSDHFDQTGSITLVPCTTDPTDAPILRLEIAPDMENGLRGSCRMMVDKITTVPKSNLGSRVGRLTEEDMMRLNRAMIVFLGIA